MEITRKEYTKGEFITFKRRQTISTTATHCTKQWKSKGSTLQHSWTIGAALLFVSDSSDDLFFLSLSLVPTSCFLPSASGCQFIDLKMGEEQPNGTKPEETGIAG